MNLLFIFNNILNIKISLLYIMYMYILLINNWEENVLFIFLWSFIYDVLLGFFLGRSFLVYFLSTYIIFFLKDNFAFLSFFRMFFFIVFFSFLIRIISFLIDNVLLDVNINNNFILINSFFDGFLWFFLVSYF